MNGDEEISSKCNKSYDVIVVGAGIAGSSLAYALAKDGRRVHVIERNLNERNTIAGEFLQPAGYLKLLELGLDDCVNDIDAQKMVGYAVHKDGKSIKLPYPLEKYESDVCGRAFHHGRFVQKLREKAASLPNVKLEQRTVTSLIEEHGEIKGVRYRSKNDQESRASLTVICDGGFSSFRKFLANTPKIDQPTITAGLILEDCQITHRNCAQLILGDPLCAVAYPISSSEVRFFAELPAGPKIPSVSNGEMAHYLKTFMAPNVPPEMCSAFISAVEKGNIRTRPISCMPASPRLIPRALLIGDALNLRHVITAAGMTVALHDVTLVCDLLRDMNLDDTTAVTKQTQYFYKIRKPMASTMNVMADSVYKMVFSSTNYESRKVMHRVLFDYLSLGRTFSDGPVGLISGLHSHHAWKLVPHLFAIAICLIGSMLLPVPSPKRVFDAARFAMGAAASVIPIILKEL